MTHRIPYAFSFQGGIARRGYLARTSSYFYGGMRHLVGYQFNDDRLLRPFGHCLETAAADLIDVCVAIALCDRYGPRSVGAFSGGHKARFFDVVIAVRQPEVWMRREVLDRVTALAESLSMDDWQLRFEKRQRAARPSEMQLSFPVGPAMNSTIVALHSGGLDSLLGMAKVLSSSDQSVLAPVSTISNSKARRVIEEIIRSLRRAFPRATFLGSQLGLSGRGSLARFDSRERDYRTRILPCLAAGAVVAACVGSGRLQLTENGPGAINLPTSNEQLDAWVTRATHPKTLSAFGKLASLVLERDVRINNTGIWETKGQLTGLLNDTRFQEPAALTVSCERFPYNNRDSPCGTCMSCLYRRMALYRAGMTHIDTGLVAKHQQWRGHDEHLESSLELVALSLFATRLDKLLSTPDPYRALDAEYLRIDEVRAVAADLGMTDASVQRALATLYQEFLNDINRFLGGCCIAYPSQRALAS